VRFVYCSRSMCRFPIPFIALTLLACSGEDRVYDADVPRATCPGLAESLSGTLQALEQHRFPELYAFLDGLEYRQKRWGIEVVVRWLERVYPLLKGHGLPLPTGLAPDATLAPGALELDALLVALRAGQEQCELAPLVPLLERAFADPELVRAMVRLVLSGGVEEVLRRTSGKEQAGPEDLVKLLKPMLLVLANPQAKPEALADLVDNLFPTGTSPYDQDPYPALRQGVRRLLTEDPAWFPAVASGMACLDQAGTLAPLPAFIADAYFGLVPGLQWTLADADIEILRVALDQSLLFGVEDAAAIPGLAELFRALADSPQRQVIVAEVVDLTSDGLMEEISGLFDPGVCQGPLPRLSPLARLEAEPEAAP
jgi:hypothetical protein